MRLSESKLASATRRSFLKSLGVAAAALPFYSMLENSAVAQVTGQTPLKFVGLSYFHAKPARYYYRRPGESDTDYDLSYTHCALKPLAKYQRRTIIFEGFGYSVGDGGDSELYQPMHGALGCFLTGSATKQKLGDSNFRLQNASLDHYLAQKFGANTAFRSLELCSEADLIEPTTSFAISYGDLGAIKSRLTAPDAIWDKCFKGFTPSNLGGDAAAHRRRVDASILDYIASDLTRLNGRLANTEKAKLDQHLTSIRDLERRLSSDPVLSASCTTPQRHGRNDSPGYVVSNGNNGGEYAFDTITNYQIELVAEMLICGLTRFATMVFAGASGHTREQPNLATFTDMALPYNFHDDIAHMSQTTVEVDQLQASMCRYYYSKMAKLMDILDAAGELDNTVILMGNEGGHGAGHSHKDVPLVLAGGANYGVRGGRRILAPGRTAPSAEGEEPGGNDDSPHNPILVAIANLFGENLTKYGTCSTRPEILNGISNLITS
jgi:Protein of unknown function (DUF1552)